MKKTLAILAIAGLCIFAGTIGSTTAGAQGRNISIKGSDTMVLLGQKWAETYMKKNTGVTLQVTGGGSGIGLAALINGTTDIAESSRPMKDTEKTQLQQKRGLATVELPVALDGLAVYVHDKNPLTEITLEQLKKIYTGVAKNWKEVGGNDERIILYGRENSSGTYAYFKENVLENADYYPTTQTLPGTAAVINAVSKDIRGIGYGGIRFQVGEGDHQTDRGTARRFSIGRAGFLCAHRDSIVASKYFRFRISAECHCRRLGSQPCGGSDHLHRL
jgi:phosphate transport system substrate-binding protein